MAIINGKVATEVEIDLKSAIIALSEELKVYEYIIPDNRFWFKIEDNKIIRYEDDYQCPRKIESEDVVTVKNFELINQLIKINNIKF